MQTQDAVSPDGEQFLPLPEAALALRVSPRKLKNLLARRGLPIFSFGSRTQRVKAEHLQLLIRSAQEPANP